MLDMNVGPWEDTPAPFNYMQ